MGASGVDAGRVQRCVGGRDVLRNALRCLTRGDCRAVAVVATRRVSQDSGQQPLRNLTPAVGK